MRKLNSIGYLTAFFALIIQANLCVAQTSKLQSIAALNYATRDLRSIFNSQAGLTNNAIPQVAGMSAPVPGTFSTVLRWTNGTLQVASMSEYGSNYIDANKLGNILVDDTDLDHDYVISPTGQTQVPMAPGMNYSSVKFLNDLGQMVVKASISSAPPFSFHYYLLSAGQFTDINTLLPANSGFQVDGVLGLNNVGSFLLRLKKISNGNYHMAMLKHAGQSYQLFDFGPGGSLTAMNDKHEVLGSNGYWSEASGWQNLLQKTGLSYATAINNNSEISGTVLNQNSQEAAFWSPIKGLVRLNQLVPVGTPPLMVAVDLNDTGAILTLVSRYTGQCPYADSDCLMLLVPAKKTLTVDNFANSFSAIDQ